MVDTRSLVTTGGATNQDMETFRRNFAQKASNEEWSLFVQTCKAYGLNPIKREIYLVSRWNQELNRYAATAQVAIGAMIGKAEETKQFRGFTQPVYIDEDGNESSIWLTKKTGKPYPYAIRVGVHRLNYAEPTMITCYFHEVCQTTKSKELTKFWRDMGIHMLEKCAYAKALRYSFSFLAGLYISEEMLPADQEASHITIIPSEPAPEDPQNNQPAKNEPPVIQSHTKNVETVDAAPPASAPLSSIPTEQDLKVRGELLGYTWRQIIIGCFKKDIEAGKKRLQAMVDGELTPDDCAVIDKKLTRLEAEKNAAKSSAA